jgi:flagellin
MAVTIGSNIGALRGLRALAQATSESDRVFERLSSGQRINRAADDPAGLSVSSVLNSKSRVLNRAVNNLSDGTSLLTIADEALGQIGSVLFRLSELAEQAANGSFSNAQRRTLGAEFTALGKEIERIGATTSFNGLNLLSGTRTARASSVAFTDAPGVSSYVIYDVSENGRFVYGNDDIDGDFVIDTITKEKKATNFGFVLGPSPGTVSNDGDVVRVSSDSFIERFSFASGAATVIGGSTGSTGLTVGSVSADGRYLAVVSAMEFVEGQSAAGVTSQRGDGRIFLWRLDVATGVTSLVTEVTDSPSSSLELQISADGQYIAYRDNGSLRIADATNRTAPVRTFTQSGTLFGVSSSGDALVTSGGNIFRSNAGASFDQLTSSGNIANFVLNGEGTSLTFRSSQALTGIATNGAQQVFTLDLGTGSLTMQTAYRSNAAGISTTSTLSRDGLRAYRFDLATSTLNVFDLSLESNQVDFEAGFGASGRVVSEFDALWNAVRGLGSGAVFSSAYSARTAIDRTRANLESVASLRGRIGASQARLAVATNLARAQAEESTAASSRIRDADIAGEAASLVRSRILREAGVSVLAQVNQQPALALSLLR